MHYVIIFAHDFSCSSNLLNRSNTSIILQNTIGSNLPDWAKVTDKDSFKSVNNDLKNTELSIHSSFMSKNSFVSEINPVNSVLYTFLDYDAENKLAGTFD
jgi:hypothetical protein